MSIDCSLCCETFKKNNTSNCPYCSYVICKPCWNTYLISVIKVDKPCPNCQKTLTRKNLIDMFTKIYVDNTLKNHIKEVLMLEDKAQISHTLKFIDIIQEKDNLIEKINTIKDEINNEVKYSLTYYIKIHSIGGYKQYIKNELNLNGRRKLENIKKSSYIYPCKNPDCEGFVNSDWYCLLCKQYTCKECHKIIDDNHVCDKDDIETAKIINKDTKPCPGCKNAIMKSSGCDQMWCWICHTAFDWKTGNIVKKNRYIHNPEYFRYMRENGIPIDRNPDDNLCDDNNIQAYWRAHSLLWNGNNSCNYINLSLKDKSIFHNTDVFKNISNIEQLYRHYNHVIVPDIRGKIRDTVISKWYNDNRYKFLTKKITENQYKINLARKHKFIEYYKYYLGVVELIKVTLKDTYIEYVQKIKEAQPEFVHKKYSSNKQIQDGINLDKDLLNRKNKINELIKVFHKDLSNTSEIYNYSDSSVIRHIKFIQND